MAARMRQWYWKRGRRNSEISKVWQNWKQVESWHSKVASDVRQAQCNYLYVESKVSLFEMRLGSFKCLTPRSLFYLISLVELHSPKYEASSILNSLAKVHVCSLYTARLKVLFKSFTCASKSLLWHPIFSSYYCLDIQRCIFKSLYTMQPWE